MNMERTAEEGSVQAMSPHARPTHHAEVHDGHANEPEKGDKANDSKNNDDAFPDR